MITSSLAVADPEIPEVLDRDSAEYRLSAEVIGCLEEQVSKLRLELRTRINNGNPWLTCPLCGVPVYLVCRHDRRLFHFRHEIEDGRCSAHTRGELSQREIDARKYNGAKESRLHWQMKNWIAECLGADVQFSDIAVEGRWTGRLTGEWRKPDVRATFRGIPVAFEVQLSTTHLNVIAERRSFYLREGGLLFWVFAKFDAESRRLTESDVFFNNNQNAFIVDAASVQTSLATNAFHLQCLWAEPTSRTEVAALGPPRLVAFADLTLDVPTQRAYFYDFEEARSNFAVEEDSALTTAREAFERYWLTQERGANHDPGAWAAIWSQLRILGFDVPSHPRRLPSPRLNALYSAKHGRPVGWNFRSFIEVAHWVAHHHKPLLREFRLALMAYDRGDQITAEDKSGRWHQKTVEYKQELRADNPEYQPTDGPYDALVAFLFPELTARRARRILAPSAFSETPVRRLETTE